MRRHRPLILSAAAFLLAAVVAENASAQQATRMAGIVSGTQEVLNSIDLPDGRSIRRMVFSVGVTADDHTSPWHLGSQDCLATYVFDADGALIGGRGVCDFVSLDGDLYWFVIEASGTEPVRWRGLGGTGRFAGIEASGTTVISAQWSDGKLIGRWEGTMTRK